MHSGTRETACSYCRGACPQFWPQRPNRRRLNKYSPTQSSTHSRDSRMTSSPEVMVIPIAERRIFDKAARSLRPPPRWSVSQWADESPRYLSPESSAEPGPWSNARAPYQRDIMDALNDPAIETVVIMSSAQIGKTEIINNILGYFIDQDPSPILVVMPTLEIAHAWSKDRLAPMLRDTPSLRGKVKEAKAKLADNTMLHKKFPGGHLTIAGANSPSSLA